MATTLEQSKAFDLCTAELVEILIERLTQTNGIEFVDPKQLALLSTLINDQE